MTIEASLERIAIALEALANKPAPVVDVDAPKSVPPAPVVDVDAPKSVPPAAPFPSAPPAPAPSSAPFTDAKGMMAYVMSVYQQLGPDKGSQIQGILNAMGFQNINDVQPAQYGDLHARIEALKG